MCTPEYLLRENAGECHPTSGMVEDADKAFVVSLSPEHACDKCV